jgi:NAD(P)-dependent dehydrogenase (short-subunit alcohol dehydrogenase family)
MAGGVAPPRRVLVIGASRGIGLELVRQYREAGAAVTGSARSEAGLSALQALGASALRLDLADAASASALAWPLDGAAFDVVVHNAGVYGPRTSGLEPPSAAEFDQVMHNNVLGAMRALPQLMPALAPQAVLAFISSRMGAIGPRTSSGGWLYRASKAALNSVMKDAALTLAGRATVVALHPGWVRTDMGGAGADLDVADSVRGIRSVLAGLRPADSGGFFDYQGQPIGF